MTLVVISASRAPAMPEKIVGFDVGGGVPTLIAVQGMIYALPHFQVGLSYGLLPGGADIVPAVKFAPQTVTLGGGETFSLTPIAKTSLSTLAPFVRYFPGEGNFYFQLTYAMMKTHSKVTGTLRHADDEQPVPDALVSGTVDLTQAMPTLSIGHLFIHELFYVNFSLGVSILTSLSADVSLTGTLPDSVGGNSAQNQAELANVKAQILRASNTAIGEFKKKTDIIPSVMLFFGFMI